MKLTDQIELGFTKTFKEKFSKLEERYVWIDYCISPLITAFILLVVYYIKGVYPFGNNTIAYYDMPTNYVPGYSWTWDVLHGKIGLLVSWYSGMIVSNTGIIGDFLLFPTNLFFFFVSRDKILFSLSLYLILEMSLSAFSMSLYSRVHKRSILITVCSGILYAFSGFALQYYSNIFFLNIAIIFPLIVWGLEKLMFEHKFLMFTILMVFASILNVQLVLMLFIYLVFKSYVYYCRLTEEMRGRSLRLLGLSLFIAVITVCLIQLPAILVLASSSRVDVSKSFDYVEQMKNVYSKFRNQKRFMVYGSEVAVGFFLLVILKSKKLLKKYSDSLVMILILALPILHEGITRIWHAGSYQHFPIRFGYMLTFECLIFWGRFFSEEEVWKNKYFGKASKLLGYALIPFIAYVLFEFCKGFCKSGIFDLGVYQSYWIYFLTLSFSYFLFIYMETDASRNTALLLLVLIQAFCGAYGFIAPKDAEFNFFRIKYTLNAIELREDFNEKPDYTKRIKSNPSEYESNYAAITGQPTFSYWSNAASSDISDELHKNLAYDGSDNYVMDSGGTVFSDALLGITQMASSVNSDEKLYTKDESKSHIYNCKYTIPFGVVIDDAVMNDESLGFEHHNNLFRFFTGLDDELISCTKAEHYVVSNKRLSENDFKIIDEKFKEKFKELHASVITGTEEDKEMNDDQDGENSMTNELKSDGQTDSSNENEQPEINEFELSFNVDKESSLYLLCNAEFEGYIIAVVNDKPVMTESLLDFGNYYFPNNLRRGILALGSFENETVDLKIYSENENLDNIDIGLLDLTTLQKGIDVISERQSLNYEFDRSTIHITGNTNMAGTLFIPYGYSNGWYAKVNGIKTKIRPCINNAFISVDVPKGNVDIEISFRPKGMVLGIILFFVGVCLTVALFIFLKRGGISGWKYEGIADKLFIYGYMVIVVAFFIFMYVVPIYIKMAL